MADRKAVIIGAGPAGLTAAIELLRRTDIRPIVLERSHEIGGISRTARHNGNHIDIGGHRFFTKSERVQKFWESIVPIQEDPDHFVDKPSFITRNRLSRILFQRHLFDYPLSINPRTIRALGIGKVLRCAMSYLKACLLPVRNEASLQDFLINRFGKELYLTFFRDYTEKVWGVPCDEISAEWGAQRIKGLSISKAVLHFFRSLLVGAHTSDKEKVETSLINKFIYPTRGPGEFWELVAEEVRRKGGEVILGAEVNRLEGSELGITSVGYTDSESKEAALLDADYVFSTTSIKELVGCFSFDIPHRVRTISQGLQYRDFITVGLLLDQLRSPIDGELGMLSDNWIYIQESDVKVGRLQIFNNWSPYMVKDPSKAWVGLEYFCNEGDELWSLSNAEMIELATDEMRRLGFINSSPIDAVAIKVPKAYPAYFGEYRNFWELRSYLDQLPNLFLVGRNGMHRYNNQDHSILTSMCAVDTIIAGKTCKRRIWDVNTEQGYHEDSADSKQRP
jgi:protoporphyrinogen oxidase